MAKRPTLGPAPIELRHFTIEEIGRAIAKLQRRIKEVTALDPSLVSHNDAKVDNVERNIRETVREIYGTNSPEFNDHGAHRIWHGGFNAMDGAAQRQAKFAEGIPQTITVLEGLIARLEEKREDLPHDGAPPAILNAPVDGARRLFLVHGHDEATKEAVARYLEKIGLSPVILHEQANQGRTIIEKFEGHAAVDFAVVLLTPDDVGHPIGAPDKARSRTRQNVLFELGYFIGRLGRARVCALYKGDVEILSDYQGVIYIPMDDAGAWRLLLARELKAAGIDFDANAAF